MDGVVVLIKPEPSPKFQTNKITLVVVTWKFTSRESQAASGE
jgi:hypothetical protein